MAESAIDRRFQEVFGNTKGGAGSGNFGHGGRPGEVGGSSSGWTSESGGGSSDTGGTVVRETDKAILYRHSSGQYEEAWLPKSQITIEGDKVTVPDWIRDKKFISATIEIGGANSPHRAAVVGETEKAYRLEVELDLPSSMSRDATIFIPKSQAKMTEGGGLQIPRWLREAKEQEVREKYRVGLRW